MSKLFLDANIILDLIDEDRTSVKQTRAFIKDAILKGNQFYTSCDIFTTLYYVAAKKLSPTTIMSEFEKLLLFIDVVSIDLLTIKEAMKLLKESEDFEDLLQYVCALQSDCDAIVTNDKKFYKGALALINTDTN